MVAREARGLGVRSARVRTRTGREEQCVERMGALWACVLLALSALGCQERTEGYVLPECEDGFTWSAAHGECRDVNECAAHPSPCDPLTECVNTPGTFECSDCPDSYLGDGLSGCYDVDECAAGTSGCDWL